MKVEIEKLDHFGRGITYINGKICFVEQALPGEVVKIKIVKETKKYYLANVVDYYRLSEDRIDVLCPYDDVCGGCNLGHLSLDKENEFKCNKVKEILKKFGSIEPDIIMDTVSVNEWGYRNKVTLHGFNENLGYFAKGTNCPIRIERCLLADEKVNEIVYLLNEMAIDENIEEAVIRISNDGEEMMVSLTGEVSNYELLRNKVDVLEINNETIFGDGAIISPIGSKKYYVSSKSFFQVNKKLTEQLYNEVLDVLKNIDVRRVLDLYCGTGTIGIYVASYVLEVIGVDSSESSINDAKKNAVLNDATNCSFICDKVENVIDTFENIDMVIVDPPRAGLDSKTIESIKKIGAKHLIYISCDPVTLARDLKELKSAYEVMVVKPYNMFPRTYHCECITVLEKNIKRRDEKE